MDIQFNNLRQEKDHAGVIFCDQNCRLIGFGKKLDQLSKKHISSIIKGDESFQNKCFRRIEQLKEAEWYGSTRRTKKNSSSIRGTPAGVTIHAIHKLLR